MRTREVPQVRGLSREWFRRLYEQPRRPVVFAGALDGRAALSTWSFERLGAEALDVAVRVSRRGAPQLFDGDPGRSFEYRRLPIRAALEGMSCPNREVWYVQHVDLTEAPVLHAELGPFDLVPAGASDESKLWVCGGGTQNPLHWDTHHAALGQIAGEKRFVLFSPEDSSKVASFVHRTLWRTTGLDVGAIDRERYPRIGAAEAWTCTVRPGDVLFVPYGWWHYMECDEPAISVTWWWTPSLAVHVRDTLREALSSWTRRGLRAVRDVNVRGRRRRDPT
jgi:ribosomal protein L16 Arg81 hydroxylase